MKIFLHFLLYQMHLAKPWTCYTEEACQALERYASGRKRLAEIGCWHGVNTARLRRAMASDGILFAIDPYLPGRLGFSCSQIIAHNEVAKVANGKVQWLCMTDLEAAAWFRARDEVPLELIYSDALNTYEGFKACWEAWSPLLVPHGIYVLANSRSSTTQNIDQAGSAQFTRDVIVKDPRFELLETVDTFTILRRRP